VKAVLKYQSAALDATAYARAAQTAQKKANPQNGSQELQYRSVNSPEPPTSEPSWAGTSAHLTLHLTSQPSNLRG
jgi:phage terminase large subunit GpA-like protein